MNEATMPVLIGCAQVTDKQSLEDAQTPLELMAQVAQAAAADAGPGQQLLDSLDTVVAVGLTVDSPESASGARGMIRNVPGALCRALGIAPAEQFYTHTGGNTPQMLVNRFAEKIAQQEASAVLLVGAEALQTMISRLKQGLNLDDWIDKSGGDPQMLGDSRAAATDHEMAYGMQTPATTYPLFENALRAKYGLNMEQHHKKLGELYQRFNAVAAQNPLSWFPTERSADEIALMRRLKQSLDPRGILNPGRVI